MSDQTEQIDATPPELSKARQTDLANQATTRRDRATGKASRRAKPAPEPMPGVPLTDEDQARLEALHRRHQGTSPFGTSYRQLASQTPAQRRTSLPGHLVPDSGPVRSRIAEAARQRLTQAELSVIDGSAKPPKPTPFPPINREVPTVTAAPSRARRLAEQRNTARPRSQAATRRTNGLTPDVHGAPERPAGHTVSAWADLADGADRDFRPFTRE